MWISGRSWTLVLACTYGAVLASGCEPTERQADTLLSAPSPDVRRPGIRFDPDTLAAGARVGGLVLETVRSVDPAAGRDAASASFRGEITLTGQTLRHPDDDLAVVSVCFEADSASAARMPRWEGDERRPWFCFSNRAEATRLLAAPGEIVTASVVIDRFTIYYGVSDEVNSARLVRVLSRTPDGR